MKNNVTKDLSWIAIVSALYVVVTLVFAPISYGPIQVRISEALTLLPFFDLRTIPALFVGCLIANIFGGLGIYDIVFGSLLTLLAAYLTSKIKNIYLAGLPPVLVNAFGVSFYLSVFFKLPYFLTVLYIGIGESIAVYLIGLPLALYIKKKFYKDWRFGR